MISSPGSVKLLIARYMPGTTPGLKAISDGLISQSCRFFIHSDIAFMQLSDLKLYPSIGCSVLFRIASIIKSGVSKSMSATHIGKTSSKPKKSFILSYLIQSVPLRSIIVSKSQLFFIILNLNDKRTGNLRIFVSFHHNPCSVLFFLNDRIISIFQGF